MVKKTKGRVYDAIDRKIIEIEVSRIIDNAKNDMEVDDCTDDGRDQVNVNDRLDDRWNDRKKQVNLVKSLREYPWIGKIIDQLSRD